MSIAVVSSPVCETRQGPASSAHSLAAQIYACLKNDIFDFRLLPGDRFSEGEIATRMQVSRTPVRQALFWLQRDGYVDVHFKSGWQIKAFDFKYFEDLYEVRTLMETSAVASLVGESLQSLQPLREVWCVPEEQRETDPPSWPRWTRPSIPAWWPRPAIRRWRASTWTLQSASASSAAWM